MTITQEIRRKPRSKFYAIFAVNADNGRQVEVMNTRQTTQEAAELWAKDNASFVRIWFESASTWSMLVTPKEVVAS